MATTAFDAHAADYDTIASSALGRELRNRVHAVLSAMTSPGDTVIDLGCGTGADAAWLAPQVRSVQAFDASFEMVALAAERCAGLDNTVVRQADAASVEIATPVDLVLVNFGVVNCVGDLSEFGNRLRGMLKPGGDAVIVTMPRWCPVELAIGAATANRELLRRRRPDARNDRNYQGLELRYASARSLEKAFGADFDLTHVESLGCVLPPFEQRGWVEHRPRLLRILATIDRSVGPAAARAGVGDHHIAVFRRRHNHQQASDPQ